MELVDTGIFISLVKNHLNFLITEYGFSIAKEDSYQVRFENSEVFLTIHYDASRSYELDVEIGQLGALFNGQERPFNLGEVLRTENTVEGKTYQAFQSSDPAALEHGIEKLALLVSSHLKDYLLNNKFSFKRLSDLREAECGQYALMTRLAGIRREAQMAWQNKDYSRVVTLYEPIEAMITEAEKKKLSFAQRHAH